MKKHAAKLLAAGFAGTLALSPPCEAMAAVKWDGSRFSVYNDSGGLTAVTDDIDEAYRAETALAAPSPAVGDTAKFLGLLDGILTKVVGAGMSEDEKVRAVYEFLMFQFAHNGERLRSNGRAIEMPDTSLGTLRLGAPALRAYNLFRYGHGDCSIFSAAFAVMLTRIGIDCEIYEGYYINSNGSKVHHYWNRANVGGDWYWYDVDVDGTIWRRDGKLMFMLYKKGASEWKKTHKSGWWQVYSAGDVRGAVPAGFAAVALPAPAPDLNAGAPDSPEPTVIYNGERIEFEAPPILDGGYAIVPARELFEGMGATVDWTPGADGTGMTVIERGGVRLRIVPSLGICVKETADGVSDIAAEASATVYAGRVYVPARSLAEAFGAEVAWDGGTLTVTIFE